jgi:hypothetical protein
MWTLPQKAEGGSAMTTKEEVKAFVKGILGGYVSTDNWGYCKGCGRWKDLRYGYCYECCIDAEWEAGLISESKYLEEKKRISLIAKRAKKSKNG